MEFIRGSDTRVGKREIAKHFRLKGQEKIALKALLKDMAEEGLIDSSKSAFHKMGGVPRVTVLRVVEIDDGEPIAVPESWNPDDGSAPPRLRVIEKKKQAALRTGDRILARTEEKGSGWLAHPMKKLAVAEDQMLGVIEIDGVANPVEDDFAVIVPAGARHNVINNGTEPLRLYTIYGPPEHMDGIVHSTKDEAEARHHDEEWDGGTTE